MKKLYLFLIIPFLMGATIPEPPKDDKSSVETQQYLKTIYEELKRDNASLVNLTSGVTGTLPIVNGGTASTTAQTAIDALLPSQTGNSGKFLTTNATNSSWGTTTDVNTSNVIFSWSGVDTASGVDYGLINSASLTTDPDTTNATYSYLANDTTTYRTLLTFKFIKIAGISTVTINARLWSSANGATQETVLNVDIGGQSNTVQSVTSTTPTWVTASTIGVSGLTNGTTYDGVIQLKNEANDVVAYCSAVILTGS